MKKEIDNRVSYCNSKSHPGISGRKPKSYDNHMNTIRKSSANHTEDDNEDDNEIKDMDENKNTQEIPVRLVRKIFIPPTFEEFEAYCNEHNYKNIARNAYDGYAAADWHDSRGKKIKNWKQKLHHVWFRDDNADESKSANFSSSRNPTMEELRDQANRIKLS